MLDWTPMRLKWRWRPSKRPQPSFGKTYSSSNSTCEETRTAKWLMSLESMCATSKTFAARTPSSQSMQTLRPKRNAKRRVTKQEKRRVDCLKLNYSSATKVRSQRAWGLKTCPYFQNKRQNCKRQIDNQRLNNYQHSTISKRSSDCYTFRNALAWLTVWLIIY